MKASIDADAGVTVRTVTWTADDPTIVKIDTAGVITALKHGATFIRAASVADPNVAATCSIFVAGV